MTAFHHASTKRARAQKSDRPARERELFGQAHTYGRAILILILMAPTLYGQAVTVGAVSTGALILFYSKNRYGATPGRAFPHLAYIRRGRCLFATYALRKTVLSSARTARLNGLRGFGPRSRIRDIFGSGNHHSAVLNGSAIEYTCGTWLVTHRTVLQTKNPGRKGPGLLINGG